MPLPRRGAALRMPKDLTLEDIDRAAVAGRWTMVVHCMIEMEIEDWDWLVFD